MDWIGAVHASEEGWEHLERLVDIRNRMAGTEGERRAAEATREAFGRHAEDARLDEFEVPRWERVGSTLRTGEGEEDCIALPRSTDGTVSAPLYDAGYGLPGDFDGAEGCVVIASSDTPEDFPRFVHRREKYCRALDAGAVGFVFRNHVGGCLAPTGSVNGRDEPYGPIPAVGVSKEVGARLVRRHADEEVTVGVEARTNDDGGEAESANVHAETGPETDDRILVTCHVDAHDTGEGAVDNGAGVAACVEVAKALSQRRDEPGRKVEFVGYGAEEVGLVGSERHAGRADDVAAVVNVDGIMRSRDLRFYTHGFDGLARAVEETTEALGIPAEVVSSTSPHSDHWSFFRRGVPTYHVKSATEGRDRGWGHTAADTFDKLDIRNLREASVFLTELVFRLSHAEPSHVGTEEVGRRLSVDGFEEGLRITGDWL